MSLIKVGRTPYLSSEPLCFDMPKRGIEVQELPPRELPIAISEGHLHGGLIPLVDCFPLAESMRTVVGFCVATISRAMSVNLSTVRPLNDMNGARIAVPHEAPTAVKLLQVLLSLKHGVEPAALVSSQDPHDGILLVGSQGLRYRRVTREFPHQYDLGEEWHRWTGLPFVFARFVVRSDLPTEDAMLIEDSLYTSLQDWADGVYRISGPAGNLPMHPREILRYTKGIRYFIGVPEEKSMALFGEYLGQLVGG
jgi:chorismate dehydratase